MLETPHVAVGAAIATKIPNPLISIPLAFLSHFVLEKVPHWNPHIYTETKNYGRPTQKSTNIIIVDCVLALITGSFFAYKTLPDLNHAITIMLASFASVLPDVIEAPFFYLNMKQKFLKNWIAFQKTLQNDTTPFWGILTQLITIIAATLWSLKGH